MKEEIVKELTEALFSASDDKRQKALCVLRGGTPVEDKPTTGPLLLNMAQAAKFLGISRTSLWRLIHVGKLIRVELMSGSFRVRRSDLEDIAAGRKN